MAVKMMALRDQVGGNHYRNLEIQPIEYILRNNLGFVEGNVIKYITRWQQKGGVEDLQKTRHYLELLIEHTLTKHHDGEIHPAAQEYLDKMRGEKENDNAGD